MTSRPVKEALLFLGIFFLCALLCNWLTGYICMNIFDIEIHHLSEVQYITQHPYQLLTLQGINTCLFFALPCIVFSLTLRTPFCSLYHINKRPKKKWIIYVLLLCFVSMLTIPLWVQFMSQFTPPTFIAQIQKQQNQMTTALMSFTSPYVFLLAIVVIAVLPALCEELFFRGGVFELLKKNGLNTLTSIGLSSILFGVIHMHFDHLLAIIFMGSVFAYVYQISHNLWLSIGMHFLNNVWQVSLHYLKNIGFISFDEQANIPYYISLLGGVLLIILLTLCYKKLFNPR